jgi:hypothetical protein
MSRTPASYAMPVVRGSTWEDEFTYDDDAGAPVDLTGYEARMQVRTLDGEFGTTTTTTLLLELLTTGADPGLIIDTPAGGTVPNRIRIAVDPAAHAVLNPDNAKKMKYAYWVELYIPAGTDPEYVIPLVKGKLSVAGRGIH